MNKKHYKNIFRDRKKYCDETSIPKELLMWQDPYDPVKSKPDVQGRNDVLVRIGQALLQGQNKKNSSKDFRTFLNF